VLQYCFGGLQYCFGMLQYCFGVLQYLTTSQPVLHCYCLTEPILALYHTQ
jgi:hypothetical protein